MSGFSTKKLLTPSEFFLFYWLLNKIVCANLLPLKHSSKIGQQHGKILNCIGKRTTFNVGLVIHDEIINQSHTLT